MPIAYYGSQISPHLVDTPEGFLICKDVPIARTGPQDYLARELMLDGDPDRLVTVQRHPKDVFEGAALASFEGKPITDGHPPESVSPENYAAYAKGHVQNVRRDGEYIVADLYINDANLANEVRNNVKREVSCGYLCNYVPDGTGYKQSRIRGNHVAVVPKGRAGAAVAIKDAAPEAEKGRKTIMSYWKTFLAAFAGAARDAEPEELDKMVETTATALDAEPAGEAQDANPVEEKAAAEEKVQDEETVEAPKGDDIGSKLDRILEMLMAKSRGGEGEHRLRDETDLDEMVKRRKRNHHPSGERLCNRPRPRRRRGAVEKGAPRRGRNRGQGCQGQSHRCSAVRYLRQGCDAGHCQGGNGQCPGQSEPDAKNKL